ncbi:hypothetical protein HaLaN_00237, partial [Haematococcus lacustris]
MGRAHGGMRLMMGKGPVPRRASRHPANMEEDEGRGEAGSEVEGGT